MKKPLHDPVPDGKTGPFMREPHKKMGSLREGTQVLAFDARCNACMTGARFDAYMDDWLKS